MKSISVSRGGQDQMIMAEWHLFYLSGYCTAALLGNTQREIFVRHMVKKAAAIIGHPGHRCTGQLKLESLRCHF